MKVGWQQISLIFCGVEFWNNLIMSLDYFTCTLKYAALLRSLIGDVDGNGGEYFAQKVNLRYFKFQLF